MREKMMTTSGNKCLFVIASPDLSGRGNLMTLAENKLLDVRSVSGIIPGA